MLKDTFNIDIWRTITHSWGRFIAIFAIVALGVGFYAGLRMTAPDMRLAADAFYDDTNLMDIRIVSTMGLDAEDIDEISKVDGVEDVVAAYETDVVAELDGDPYVMRVHSLPYEAQVSQRMDEVMVTYDDVSSLNKLVLEKGTWPRANNECILSADRIMNKPLSIGDKLTVTECSTGLDDTLREREYTIVGLAHSSYYSASTNMGSTTLGSGYIQQFMYVPESDFDADFPITEAFVTVEGAKDFISGSFEYQSRIDEVMKELFGIEEVREQERLRTIKDKAQAELDDARAQFESERTDAFAQLDDAMTKLNDAATTIAASEKEIAEGERAYQTGMRELAEKESDGNAQLKAGQDEIDANRVKLEESKVQLDAAAAQLEAGWATISALSSYPVNKDNAAQVLDGMKQQLAMLPPGTPAYEQLAASIEKLSALIQAQAEYDDGLKRYNDGIAQLQAAQNTLDAERASAASQIAAAKNELAKAKRTIESGRVELAQGKAEYEQGLFEYQENRDNAMNQLADAEAELDDAQNQINDIETPEWLIMDRTKNYGAESFDMDAGRVDNIAMVFPFVFFLVAALVALTTMTRMVDEERMQIGTYKALGYSRSRITSKYLIYAAIASITGSIAGIALMALTLPAIIMSAYAIMYIIPVSNLTIDWPIALTAILLGVGITLFATAAAAISTLRESPAALMLPKAPKAGKRILLERIKPIWNRLSFLWKVTCRNIFRYKKRLFMTVVGIAGCTALLLTGFGLHDSINDIIDKHYGEIVEYNMVITKEDDIADKDADALDSVLAERGQVEASADAFEDTMVVIGSASDMSVEMIVPRSFETFSQIWNFRNRVSQQQVTLDDTGVIITEKIAIKFGLDAGDTITLASQDDMGNATNERYEFPVTGIIENYIDHDVFMSTDLYEKTFHKKPMFNNQFVNTAVVGEGRDQLAADIRGIDGIKTVTFNDETIDIYKSALKSVNMVVIVLIIAAALLAFIVLYNLTNINITERMREIATLKVLGFTAKEIYQYIFREILILSFMGAALGLGLGIVLENFVVTTAEVDMVMFGRDIHWPSFVFAFLLTMLFTVIVTLSMRGKLKHIDMVESLKSNE